MPLTDRHQANLHGSKPQWKCPGIVLNQNAKKTLHGAEQGTMHHDGLMPLSVLTYIFQLEPCRQIKIKLHGRKLPQTPQNVHQLYVNFWPVKRCFTGDE